MAAYCSAHAETVAWNIWKTMKNQEKVQYKQRKQNQFNCINAKKCMLKYSSWASQTAK